MNQEARVQILILYLFKSYLIHNTPGWLKIRTIQFFIRCIQLMSNRCENGIANGVEIQATGHVVNMKPFISIEWGSNLFEFLDHKVNC